MYCPLFLFLSPFFHAVLCRSSDLPLVPPLRLPSLFLVCASDRFSFLVSFSSCYWPDRPSFSFSFPLTVACFALYLARSAVFCPPPSSPFAAEVTVSVKLFILSQLFCASPLHPRFSLSYPASVSSFSDISHETKTNFRSGAVVWLCCSLFSLPPPLPTSPPHSPPPRPLFARCGALSADSKVCAGACLCEDLHFSPFSSLFNC